MSSRHHATPRTSPPVQVTYDETVFQTVYGGLPCVWMSAGLVAYKLCDRGFECDGCPFDQAMRGAVPPPGPPIDGRARRARRGGARRPVRVGRSAAAGPTIDPGSDGCNGSRGYRVSIIQHAAFERGGPSDGGR